MPHFMDALRSVEPAAVREFYVEHPTTRWADVGGLDDVRKLLLSVTCLGRTKPQLLRQSGIRAPRGILLSGPPGTGKSLIVRALAGETGYSLIVADAATVLSKWVGESEKALRQVFRKARMTAPCIVVLDDLDALAPRRRGGEEAASSERVVVQLLHEPDELADFHEVIVIGTTNRIDLVDPAVSRPGRFDLVVRLDAPDYESRLAILRVHAARLPLGQNVDLGELAARTEGFTGAELTAVCQRAGIEAILESSQAHSRTGTADLQVEMRHLLRSLDDVAARRAKR
jgi:transitional endoplasmic reticulum ATPase